jgi:CHASE2 domain-containing sensor protein/nitrogen-specific signal transduction histidine kinase
MNAPPSRPTRTRLRRWALLNIVLLGLAGLLSFTYPVQELSRRASDLYFRLRAPAPSSSQVALVLIDDASLERYGRWPWSRSLLARLVRAVSAQHPRAIGIDILLSEPQNSASDSDLAAAIRDASDVILAAKIGSTPGGRAWVEPLPLLARAAAGVGHVQAELGPDGICRRVPVREMTLDGPRPAFAVEVMRVARGERASPASGSQAQAGATTQPIALSLQFLTVDFRGQVLPGRSPFPVLSAADLLDAKGGGRLQGKAVLIGFASTEITDSLPTPVGTQLLMPGVEIHANLLEQLLAGRELTSLSTVVQAALLTILSLLLTAVLVRWAGYAGLAASVLLVGTYWLGGFCLFLFAGRQISFGPFLVLAVAAPLLVQATHLIEVDRRLTRSLEQLRRALTTGSAGIGVRPTLGPSAPAPDSHWKLEAVNRLQAELSSLYGFNQTLLDSMQEALAVFSPDGKLVFRNSRWDDWRRMLGGEATGTLEDLIAVLERPAWSELLMHAELTHALLETEVLRNQGLWIVRATRLPATRLAGPGSVMVVVTDLTARLERDRARAEALGFVTHELRTPLVSIQGFAEFLLRYPAAAGTSDAAQTIFRESRRLVAMIDTYLDVLRMESGARSPRREPVDVEETVRQVERVMAPLAQAAEIAFQVEIGADLPPLHGDAQLLGGALLNLVSNAVKYSPRGAVIRITVKATGSVVEFEVANPSPVIPADELARLFQPFYRGMGGAHPDRGWGLGLAFVKRIAEAHGGRAEASSDEAGTRFSIIVPAESAVAFEVQS